MDLRGSNRTLEKLHNELHNVYISPKTIMMVTSWRIVGVGYVACMGVKRNAYKTLVAQPDCMTLKEIHMHGRIILKWIIQKIGGVGMN